MADRFDLINFGKSVVTTLGGNTANVNIDANTLFIDGTNNRVGVGTAAPGQPLQISNPSSSGFATIRLAADSRSYDVGVGGSASGFQQNNLYVFDVTGSATRAVIAANGNIGVGNTTPAHALSIAGALRTTAVSTNFVQSNAVAITVNTSTPTAVCSVTITTIGKPVLLLVSGDRNPLADGNWHWGQFYRDSTPIGKQTIGQMSFASHNQPFAQCMIDTPAAGTYSYQFRVWFGQGSIVYGETGDSQAPTIIAMELI